MPHDDHESSRVTTLKPWMAVAAALIIPGGMIIGGAYLASRMIKARKKQQDEQQ